MKNKIWMGALSALLFMIHQVGADGKIEKIEDVNGGVKLTIATTVDDTYTVQCTTNLTNGGWINIGSAFTASNSVTPKTISASTDNCYFRVIKEAGQGGTGEPTEPSDPPPLPTGPTAPGSPPTSPF